MPEERNQMISVNPEAILTGYDQTGAGPLWRVAGELEGGRICSFYY